MTEQSPAGFVPEAPHPVGFVPEDTSTNIDAPAGYTQVPTNFVIVNGQKVELPTEGSLSPTGFIGSRLNQLAGNESGILNPNPTQNPAIAQSWLPETNQDPGLIGSIRHGIYENAIRPLFSPVGILGSMLGASPGDEPIPNPSAVMGKLGAQDASGAAEITPTSPASTPINGLRQAEGISRIGSGESTIPQLQPSVSNEMSPIANTTNPADLQPSSISPAADKLVDALSSSKLKSARTEWRNNLAASRGEMAARVGNINTVGEAGFNQRLAAMKNDISKPSFSPIQLDQTDVDSLHDSIGSSVLQPFEKIRAGVALNKILSGEVPQDNEVYLLRQVFGEQFAKNISNLRTLGQRTTDLISDVVNLPKSLITAGHFSAPFRQGLMLAHKPEFYQAFGEMFKAAWSEGNFNDIQDAIKSLPYYPEMIETKLPLMHLGDSRTMREEAIQSRLAEKIPFYGPHFVRPGNRAYTAFLNTVRATTFSDLVDNYHESAKLITDPTLRMESDPLANKALLQQLSDFVGAASGRGSLGSAEKYANALNATFFSPRLQAAKYQMIKTLLNPATNPIVRKEALKSFLSVIAGGNVILSLAKLGGADVSLNPTSSDFGKVKIGNARLDVWGGFQQYAVLAARLLSGQTTSSVTNKTTTYGAKFGSPTRKDAVEDFAKNKANPALAFAYDMLNAKDVHHQSTFQLTPEIAKMLTPILAQNVYDLAKEDPKLLPLAIPNAVGMGVQAYK